MRKAHNSKLKTQNSKFKTLKNYSHSIVDGGFDEIS